MIKKKIIDCPKKWHLVLSETLWSYRMACHRSIKCSPYELVYGNNVVLPWEIRAASRRILLQDKLTADDYKHLMMDNLEDLNAHRLRALEIIEANKLRIAKYYDKKVNNKQFCEGELGPKTASTKSGHQIGKGPIGLLDVYLVMLIFTRHWKGKSFPKQSMVNSLRNITRVFGLILYSRLSGTSGSNSRYRVYRL